MKLVRTEDAVGQVLCHDITQIIPGVVKDAVFRKGHIVTEEDIPVLLSVGKENLYIWEKQEGMLHENEAAEILRDKGWTIDGAAIRGGLAAVSWPGRFEILSRKPFFVLDGAHNPQGIRATAESLRTVFPGKPVVFLMGVMADKDLDGMLPALRPFDGRFVCVTPDNPRAMMAQELARHICAAGMTAEACGTIRQGASRAIHLAGENGVVCALGSLYFSADVRAAAAACLGQNGGK